MRILVTGASGLIGSTTVRLLRRAGHVVLPLVRERNCYRDDSFALHADLASPESLSGLRKAEFDAIVHCAAAIPLNDQPQTAEELANINRAMDRAVLDIALERGSPLIFISSTSVYGLSPGPWRENGPAAPAIPYSSAKLESENDYLARISACVCLRISSPYGPGQRTANVLHIFMQRALAGLELNYHGGGDRTQDFVAATDVAEAARMSLMNPAVSGVFNIASGAPICMRELAHLVVSSVPGSNSRVVASGHPDPQEDQRIQIDIGKANEQLGWSPTIALGNGIADWAKHFDEMPC